MQPKEILTLLEIIDLSSKSTAYAHITGAAHAALMNATLTALPKPDNDDDEKETHPSKKGSR
jgi:hypothetical protein